MVLLNRGRVVVRKIGISYVLHFVRSRLVKVVIAHEEIVCSLLVDSGARGKRLREQVSIHLVELVRYLSYQLTLILVIWIGLILRVIWAKLIVLNTILRLLWLRKLLCLELLGLVKRTVDGPYPRLPKVADIDSANVLTGWGALLQNLGLSFPHLLCLLPLPFVLHLHELILFYQLLLVKFIQLVVVGIWLRILIYGLVPRLRLEVRVRLFFFNLYWVAGYLLRIILVPYEQLTRISLLFDLRFGAVLREVDGRGRVQSGGRLRCNHILILLLRLRLL